MPVELGAAGSGGAPASVVLTGVSQHAGSRVVPLFFEPPCSEADLARLVRSKRFIAWASNYLPSRSPQRLELTRLCLRRFEEGEDACAPKMELEYTLRRGGNSVTEVTSLVGQTASVLAILRVQDPPPGTWYGRPRGAGGENEAGSEGATQVRRREFVLFVRRTRGSLGAPAHREIISGRLGPAGALEGPAAAAVESLCGLRFQESSLDDLTALALSTPHFISEGVSAAPDVSDERVRLLLYRETVPYESVSRLLSRGAGPLTDGQIAVELWSLSGAWRCTSDARSLAALFLFHELRYHGCMPSYRRLAPPAAAGGGGAAGGGFAAGFGGSRFQLRRAAVFSQISDLDPNTAGLNLRAKIVDAAPAAPRHSSGLRSVIVGDASGTVRLLLTEEQAARLAPLAPGAPLELRNVQFDMSDGFLAVVIDSFGKVEPPAAAAAAAHFDFEPNAAFSASATQYEQVGNGGAGGAGSAGGGRGRPGRGRGGGRGGGRGRGAQR